MLALQKSTDTLALADGIYTIPQTGLPFKLKGSVVAQNGAKPILIGSDGFAPYIEIQDNAVIDGIWFGGTKQPVDQPFIIKNNTVIRNCVIFNYYGGIVEGAGQYNTLTGNLFVGCGTESLYHTIYISNGLSDHWTIIEDNIFIGGQGYSIQLWHLPNNVTIRRNFFGTSQWLIVLNGLNHQMYDNVLWSNTGVDGATLGCNFSGDPGDGTTSFNVYHNLIGKDTQRTFCTVDQDRICHDNTFYVGVPQTFGDDAHTVTSVNGIDSNTLNQAISSLIASFQQDVTIIHTDLTIQVHRIACQNAIVQWGLQP